MVAALTSRRLGRPVNRKRAQRVMREQRLLQRHRPPGRRRRPGFFRVERPILRLAPDGSPRLRRSDPSDTKPALRLSTRYRVRGRAFLVLAFGCCASAVVGGLGLRE